ncbi:DUF805 domain-containing protein [Tenacibaculum maritimum]|uniref:DUF805 domain-containing protein n=1 Tax=Tenacibaculum maritimum TaxID=107401 RepID=UPI0012E4A7B0|nr:DUF805 domain-containing protein [Tenacibaculum maritimum]CAA0224312.1 conserved hypothetical protein; putative inner membrane protein [Tenacibaculum maritimum]
MNWYLKVLRQYSDFNGRARRQEFWMFALFNFIFASIAIAIDYALGFIGFSPIYGIYSLGVLIPNIALSIRRLHDIGKSGWLLLLAFIPLIGGIYLLILFATNGDSGNNEYGADPKTEIV